MTRISKAIFPVAGLGTRFLPATKSVPKEIMTLVNRPLIQYAIEEAREVGIEEFIFVTSRGKGALEDCFDYSPSLAAKLKAQAEGISIDYAVMEKAKNLSVVPYAGNWSDLGSWSAVHEMMGGRRCNQRQCHGG